MSDYQRHVEQDARLAILAELAQQRDATLNSRSMTQVLDAIGIRKSQDWVKLQVARLADLGAVNTTEIELAGIGRVIVATLTRAGRDHVERRALLPGVAVPGDPD